MQNQWGTISVGTLLVLHLVVVVSSGSSSSGAREPCGGCGSGPCGVFTCIYVYLRVFTCIYVYLRVNTRMVGAGPGPGSGRVVGPAGRKVYLRVFACIYVYLRVFTCIYVY